jgi:hypothetical protein
MRSLICFVVLAPACAVGANSQYTASDAGPNVIIEKELVCASNFCGVIQDKYLDASADCGTCAAGSQCNDNNEANLCGSACLPFGSTEADGGIMPACDYNLGYGWYAQYLATGGIQVSPACNYTNPDMCFPIYNSKPANGICSGEVCGNWICCLTGGPNSENPFLPGASGEDGGI